MLEVHGREDAPQALKKDSEKGHLRDRDMGVIPLKVTTVAWEYVRTLRGNGRGVRPEP